MQAETKNNWDVFFSALTACALLAFGFLGYRIQDKLSRLEERTRVISEAKDKQDFYKSLDATYTFFDGFRNEIGTLTLDLSVKESDLFGKLEAQGYTGEVPFPRRLTSLAFAHYDSREKVRKALAEAESKIRLFRIQYTAYATSAQIENWNQLETAIEEFLQWASQGEFQAAVKISLIGSRDDKGELQVFLFQKEIHNGLAHNLLRETGSMALNPKHPINTLEVALEKALGYKKPHLLLNATTPTP